MQATMGINSSTGARGGRLLASFAVAVAAALALGYGVGTITAPAGHAAPTVKVLTVPIDQSAGGQPAGEKQITHGALP